MLKIQRIGLRTGKIFNKQRGGISQVQTSFLHYNKTTPTHLDSFRVNINKQFRLFSTETQAETMEFQAETRKLLDIVTHSIYTDKEVFLRELISNAADALEKFRYLKVSGGLKANEETELPLEIHILTDPTTNTITIMDTGVGMSKEELISNLGTIARSGSKNFVEKMKENASASTTEGIIGQFGVGFYSSFMVSDEVSVESLSATTEGVGAHRWSSDGTGKFTIENIPQVEGLGGFHGSKITMKLKEACKEFADAEKLKSVMKRYSNFVPFPVRIDGEVINTVQAVWAQDPSSTTTEQYNEFYQYISNNKHEDPRYRLHFRTDAPIELKCLFFVPTLHMEKFGMGRMEPGVNLYSRKVLIESKPKDLLPEWLRFIHGAVDSEDLPLSLSREKPQDSKLLARIKDVLTRKLLRFLSDEVKRDLKKYREFYLEFNMFLKEGACSDFKFVEQISKLLMFESSKKEANDLIFLDDYIARSSPDEKNIYYLVAPSREDALNSPYFEVFKRHDKEVLLLFNTIDDFVAKNIGTYQGRKLISAESSSIDFGEEKPKNEESSKEEKSSSTATSTQLSTTESTEFCSWLNTVLGAQRVISVTTTDRLHDSPAVVTDHESGAMRRMMKMVEQANAGQGARTEVPPVALQVNPKHPLVRELYNFVKTQNLMKSTKTETKTENETENEVVEAELVNEESAVPRDEKLVARAELVANQLFDNALMAAGLVEDPRFMLPRLNELLLNSIKK